MANICLKPECQKHNQFYINNYYKNYFMNYFILIFLNLQNFDSKNNFCIIVK